MLRERNRQAPKPGKQDLGHRPFRSLRSLLGTAGDKPAPPRIGRGRAAAPETSPPRTGSEDDADLFLREVDDVKPLSRTERQRVAAPPPARPARPMVSDEAEAMAELADLVAGKSSFDVSDSDEYIEGMVRGLDRRIVGRLRRGEFAHQAHLDLHRMTAEEARPAVERFLQDAYRAGRRC